MLEEGTHGELVNKPGGAYATLWANQTDNVSSLTLNEFSKEEPVTNAS